MAKNSNDSYKPYREYVKHESIGRSAGKAAGGALLESFWELFQAFAKSKTKF